MPVEILYLLVGLLLGLLFKDYLPAYAKQKGKNLATSEDIGPITDIVEKVKQEHSAKLEEVKSYLAAAIHRHNVGFQKEFQAYEASWKTVVDLLTALERFQPGGYTAENLDETYQERGHRLGTALNQANRDFAFTIHYNRPFFSPTIFSLFQRFRRFVRKEAIIYGEEYAGRGRDYDAKLSPKRLRRVMKALVSQSKTISEAIRRRVEALQREGE